jgi:hypothetical protein
MQKIAQAFLVSLSVGLVSACGGGSSGSAASAVSTSTFSVDAAFKGNIAAPRNLPWTLTGTVQGVAVSGSGTLTESGLSASSFNGTAAQLRTVRFNGTLIALNQSAPYSQTESAYYDSGYRLIGGSGTAGTSYITQTLSTLPTAARVGDSGALATITNYGDAAKLLKTSSSTVTWALAADTANTALLKLTTAVAGPTGSVTTTTTETLRITPAGDTTKVSLDSNVSGQLLKFTF